MDLVKLVAAVRAVVKGRASEGSTWAGVGVVAATVGQLIGGPWGAVLVALGPLFGAVAVALPDRGAPVPPTVPAVPDAVPPTMPAEGE